MAHDIDALANEIARTRGFVDRIVAEVGTVIVGQDEMIHRLLIALLADGHVLVEGVPGLAKTLTVRTLAQTLDTGFQRLQFTPDLLPADLTGTMIYDERERSFYAKQGPIFSNLILADEINRAPAKVQSALLESMQERQVTIGDTTYPLPEPFIVLATQNPIEQEGTYPLPEAQVDRFMLKVKIDYPSMSEERLILERMALGEPEKVEPVIGPDDLLRAREVVKQIYIDEKIKDYIIRIVFATRFPGDFGLPLGEMIAYGASPRASIYLTEAAKCHAFICGRGFVTPEDVKSIGLDVLRHRIIPTYEAEAENIGSEDIVRQIFNQIEVP